MRNWICASMLLLLPAMAIAADAPPDWAYPAAPAGFQPPPDNGQPKHVAGSTKKPHRERSTTSSVRRMVSR